MKKNGKKLEVICPSCQNSICIKDENALIMVPVGYKENYKYCVLCENCGHSVTIDRADIPKKVIIRLELKKYFK